MGNASYQDIPAQHRYHDGFLPALISKTTAASGHQDSAKYFCAKPNSVYSAAALGNLRPQLLTNKLERLHQRFESHVDSSNDWYAIADVSRLNTDIMFMHLKADPASYEGLFEKGISSVSFLLYPNPNQVKYYVTGTLEESVQTILEGGGAKKTAAYLSGISTHYIVGLDPNYNEARKMIV